ncbi:MAG TPA: hypothetical protein VGE70_03515 [Burkholderiaceae bacterium]
MKNIATAIATTLATATFAHDGHGMTGPHWHASDLWGFGVLAIALVLLLASRK